MRIVSGRYRGRALTAPEGQATRPTSDRAREAVFNVLEHAAWSPGLADARVIDLFAGSGALGLEALSRGAAFCLFVDHDPAAEAAVLANLGALGLGDRARVLRRDASRLGARSSADGPAFDLAFLDPPYTKGLAEAALTSLADGAWLAPGGLVIAERGADEPELKPDGYEILDDRRWGAARVWFLRTG